MRKRLRSGRRHAGPAAPALALLGFAAALGGCNLGPDYTPPGIEVPAAYRATADSARTAWPSTDWWRGFGSPELDGLIADAQAYNFDIQAAVARVRQADAQVRISGSPLLPTVEGLPQYNYSRAGGRIRSPLGSSRSTDTRIYDLGLNASYEVDLWGRLRAQQQSAEASALFSRFDQQTVALTAVTAVASTWFQALAFQDRLDVLHRNLRDAQDILLAIQGRLDAGTVSQLDVAQQAALVAGLLAQEPALRSSLEVQLIGLGILTGRPPESITVRPGTLTALALPEVGAGLPSELLERRPDVQAAAMQLVAANANIRSARANFFPRLTLTGSYGLESAALSGLTGPGTMLLTFVASATQTLFDNGLKGGQYDLTKGQYDELVATYRKTVVQAFTDVDTALTQFRYATEQERLERDAVARAQLAADIVRAQVRAGVSDIVTALQAQTTLFSDLDLLAQVRLARFTALLNLYSALGGGFSPTDVAAPASTIFHGIL